MLRYAIGSSHVSWKEWKEEKRGKRKEWRKIIVTVS